MHRTVTTVRPAEEHLFFGYPTPYLKATKVLFLSKIEFIRFLLNYSSRKTVIPSLSPADSSSFAGSLVAWHAHAMLR